ncbi:hypothetical protein [Nocardia sp. NPDC024068]|uniref:hypothetical protein n=1 Tax=Nocardia sp. NPDC024068 TaxID=3157197 RepID=UPI0033D284AD
MERIAEEARWRSTRLVEEMHESRQRSRNAEQTLIVQTVGRITELGRQDKKQSPEPSIEPAASPRPDTGWDAAAGRDQREEFASPVSGLPENRSPLHEVPVPTGEFDQRDAIARAGAARRRRAPQKQCRRTKRRRR